MSTIKAETISRRQTAARMGVGVETVDRFIEAGALPGAFRVGKRWHIPTSNITRLLNRGVPSAVGSVGDGLGSPSRLEPSDSTAERIAR